MRTTTTMVYTLNDSAKRIYGLDIQNIDGKETRIPSGYIQETIEKDIYLVYCGDNDPKDSYFNTEMYNAIKDYVICNEHKEACTWDNKKYKMYFYNIKIDDLDKLNFRRF
jgi:hypothetical protein